MRYSLTNISVVIFFLLGLFLLIFQSWNNTDFNLITQINLYVIYLLCSVIILSYIFYKKFNYFIPLLPLTCFFLACYLSPSFFNYKFLEIVIDIMFLDIPVAIEVLTLGIISMLIGFFVTMFFLKI